MTRTPTPRYSIAEWYGEDITALTPAERQQMGRLAAHQDQTGDLSGAPACPFLSSLSHDARCNKRGGVCSMRRYTHGGGPDEGAIATLCPFRFVQAIEGRSLFAWIGEKMLDTGNPVVVKETPFLRTITEETAGEQDAEDRKAGRIDWLLLNPASLDSSDPEWCAVETQSLYFSGRNMRLEFDVYAAAPSEVLYPVGYRRPDYRSSGPKRLMPQLDVKVPVLRSWGKKVAVVIDRFFYDNMNALGEAFPRAKNDRERRDAADVVWFVVDYDEHLHLKAHKVVYSTLDSSRVALNATEPLGKSEFTAGLKETIATRMGKVFKV